MEFSSTAFSNGERIPLRHSCQGSDISPPLAWRDAPAETCSFALFCNDPDAPKGIWHHWALFDLPPDVTDLPEAYPGGTHVGATRHGVNDFGRARYNGPCPPRGHGSHHYLFKLLALDVKHLDAPERADCALVEEIAAQHQLAEAALTGLYAR